jgi:hypothetical protein
MFFMNTNIGNELKYVFKLGLASVTALLTGAHGLFGGEQAVYHQLLSLTKYFLKSRAIA